MPREAKISCGVLVILCVAGSFCSDVFLTIPNILNILTASATIGILSLGATFVLANKKVDLSAGSFMALTAIFGVAIAQHFDSDSSASIIFLSLICGLVGGLLSGYLIGFLKLPSFIVTLAMLSLARGAALVLLNGEPIYGLPNAIVSIGQGEVWGIPFPVFLYITLAILCGGVLRYTGFGLKTICIGDNETACDHAGIKISRHVLLIFMLSGLLSAIAGLIYMGRVNAADPAAGVTYELSAITAAIIGGTSIFGGKASIFGSVCGALILAVMQNCLTLLNISAYYQQIMIGLILVLAISSEKIKFNLGKNHAP